MRAAGGHEKLGAEACPSQAGEVWFGVPGSEGAPTGEESRKQGVSSVLLAKIHLERIFWQ